MNVTNIISALGNNASLAPIIVKDSIDNTGRIAMAYKEGSKNGKKYGMYDARERFIEENSTSLVWLGGIPALKLLYDRLVTNKIYGFNKNINAHKQGKRAFANTNVDLLAKNGLQSLQKNVDSIREAAKSNKILENVVDEADKILKNPDKFKKITSGKYAIATIIPLVTVGFIVPRLMQKVTRTLYKKDKLEALQKQQEAAKAQNPIFSKGNPPVFSSFMGQTPANKNVSFGNKLSSSLVKIFNNDVYNQVILDAGISGGRIYTGVNLADKIEKGIKEAGVVFFIYLGGPIFAKMFEKMGIKMGLPISLDSKILEDKDFHKKIVNIAKVNDPKEKQKLVSEMLKFPEYKDASFKSIFQAESVKPEFKKLGLMEKIKTVRTKLSAIDSANEKSIINFIDEQIKTGVKNNAFDNPTLKAAQTLGDVNLIENVKNPLKLINTKKVKGLNKSLKEFTEKALSKGSPEEVEKFIKKALNTKRGSILLNIAICSISTAYILPKLQYLFREKFTNSSNLPALAEYEKQFNEEQKALKA